MTNVELYCEPDDSAAVEAYAEHFTLRAVSRAQWPDLAGKETNWWLQYREQRLRLCRGADAKGVCVDPAEVRRRAVRSSELARACGLAGGRNGLRDRVCSLLDGTCGWGVDALTLAQLGAEVTMLEHSAVVWALANDLLQTQAALPVTLHHAELSQWLVQQEPGRFDVIYLDPMFPARNKTAAPNKRLQYLAALVAAAPLPMASTLDEWLALCRRHARARVVLKRRRNDPPLAQAPSWQIQGRSIRYDVYRPTQP
ncbi:MAG: class I SAM-dependent methyltransferase [Pseudomonadales bacterium]